MSRDLFGHAAPACATDITDDGVRIITGGVDATAWVVDDDGAAVVLAGHGDEVVDVELIEGTDRAVTASSDGIARWWDASRLGPVELFGTDTGAVGARLDVGFMWVKSVCIN